MSSICTCSITHPTNPKTWVQAQVKTDKANSHWTPNIVLHLVHALGLPPMARHVPSNACMNLNESIASPPFPNPAISLTDSPAH